MSQTLWQVGGAFNIEEAPHKKDSMRLKMIELASKIM